VSADIKIPCPACNGDGFVSFGDRHVENRTESCETCGGRGEVPAMTGLTPQTSAAPDGELHERYRQAEKAGGTVEVRDGSGNDLPAVVSPHSGD